MPSRPPPPENVPKAGENGSDDDSLGKFNSLAKGLFGVEREALKEAEKRFKDRRRSGLTGPAGGQDPSTT